jgi:hypothetical protein
MTVSTFMEHLHKIFGDDSLYGFSKIDKDLSEKTCCKCSLITLLPYPDLHCIYNPIEFYLMLEDLRQKHAEMLNGVKSFLDTN